MSSMSLRQILLSVSGLLLFFSAAVSSAPYTVNPGDLVQIDVWNEELLSRQVLVRPDGFISLPMAGEIDANGSSPAQLADDISSALAKYMKDVPQVVVSLVNATGYKIFVIGKVLRPGEYVLTSETDIMQALTLAGGLNTFAAENDIIVLRRNADGTQTTIPFEYARVKTGRDLETNIILHSRDVVVVP